MITPEHAVLYAILTCIGGAILTLLVSRWKALAGWLAFGVTTVTAVLVFMAVTQVLRFGPSQHSATFAVAPKFGLALRLYVDGLTSIFLSLAAVVAMGTSFYSIAYMGGLADYKSYSVGRYYPYCLLFLAAMYGLLSTTDMMWFFFIFWQMMTLPGYALIRFDHKKRSHIRAANKYLVMMEIACAATMGGAEVLAVAGAANRGSTQLMYDFDTVSANLPALLHAKPELAALAFALFLVGFGIKMGMWPFGQFWLPDAHPAAPSPVSAMLSGVMIKTGVYGLVRYFLWLVPVSAQADYPMARWGAVIAVLGTITLFTGTAQALRQDLSKRLLAFSSIGQVGYMLLAVGSCMTLLSAGSGAATALAAFALLGALFHVINHGMFKGLLFLNAGSVIYAIGTQDLNRMGGLLRFFPLTAITAMVASASISGVPLTNGFASKWTICASAVLGSRYAGYLALCALIAILTSALTLALYIKFFGASFLSRTSTLVAERTAGNARPRVSWIMQAPQVVLTGGCILLGLIPALGFRLVQLAIDRSRQGFGATLADAVPVWSGIWGGVRGWDSLALFAPLALAAVLGLAFWFAWRLSHAGGSQRRPAVPWLCGYAREADCHRYTARNFYGEVQRYFRWLGGASRTLSGD